jgi:hypothetical protein
MVDGGLGGDGFFFEKIVRKHVILVRFLFSIKFKTYSDSRPFLLKKTVL